MYKVLLVDDEILDLKGMQTFIPWTELGMNVVHSVSSGFAAAEIIESEPIDILVTDVRMPNMSGLELARKALDKQARIKIIFVSGYQDFNYVKQAMSLNACSYVVKPMDDNELIESLQKLRIELDDERRLLETEQLYQRMVPIMKNEYLLRLLEGTSDDEMLQVLLERYELNRLAWPVKVVAVERDDWMLKRGSDDAIDDSELSGLFLHAMIDVCSRLRIEHMCKLGGNRVGMLLEQGMEIDRLREALTNEPLEAPFTVTIGVGGFAGSPAELKDSYRQARLALDYKVFYGKGRIIRHEDIQQAQMKDVQSLDIQLDALFEAMTDYDLVKVHDELGLLYGLANNLRSKYTIQNFTVFLIMKLDAHLQKINEDLFQMLNLDFNSLDVLLRHETMDEIHSWLRYRVYELSELLQNKKQKKNWKLAQDIIADVKQRLHENITLKDVAEKYSFSPNYLGQIFKEEMNTNFSDYVATLRMEKAGDLLANTNLKVYEIAGLIGYRYLPYFSRQFKDYHGMTPLEFRRRP
ncbi:response regulator [Paenibacillus sp. LHD-117]|uniref:response regulator n=1 Tax=Paenibacillus sp. LHD-117 TaxID=3071412 RepID=UPI0027DF071F|nr:response regulator [Paenibacillus sp. LHD-117]MDQ6419496.1 response regulator [Paenibacillus sp. LHD-117]